MKMSDPRVEIALSIINKIVPLRRCTQSSGSDQCFASDLRQFFLDDERSVNTYGEWRIIVNPDTNEIEWVDSMFSIEFPQVEISDDLTWGVKEFKKSQFEFFQCVTRAFHHCLQV